MNGTTNSSTGSAGPQEEKSSPTQSELHRLLSSDRRRITLGVLVNCTAPLTLPELAGLVARREQVEDSVDGGIDRIALRLHHNHLPRIDEAGFIRYDSKSNHVDAIHQDLMERAYEDLTWRMGP